MTRFVLVPAAGIGSRFAPFSTAVPKEMLPILGRPAVDYLLEEVEYAGFENLVFVTSDSKKSLEDYVAHHWLGKSNRTSVAFVRQYEAKGLGHAVLVARNYCFGKFVTIALPDNIFFGGISPLAEMYKMAVRYDSSVIAVERVETKAVSSYGIVALGDQVEPGCYKVKELVEKPEANKAPSQLAVVGRYVLSSKIFDTLAEQKVGINNEIQLTDAIQTLLRSGYQTITYQIKSTFLDVGTPDSWLQANIVIANNTKANKLNL